jgi:enterochelin esterase-like enzyme
MHPADQPPSLDLPMLIRHALALSLLAAAVLPSVRAADDYKLGPDSMEQEGVPRGVVSQYKWESPKAYPGTVRDYWTYVPAQYDGKTPACVMVFQDGGSYVNVKGDIRVPTVFDNLIHKGEMPVTIGIFISPGTYPGKDGQKARSNRSVEYDTLGDQYARLLIDEILPEIGKKYKLSDNPDHRAICGISSGGICSWTVAWERPDAFRKVVSHVGSFTNIRGGHNCEALIRKTKPKPIRVFLQDGSGDLNNEHGNWPLANQTMAASLQFMKYDYQFVYGDGGHNMKQGGAIFPDTLRWLWRDVKLTKE